jgi:hypothetical protein
MKFFDKPWKKALLITGSVIIGLVILIFVFISPIAKYLIQKYDEKFLGRQITLDWIYVNPFTGYAHISGLKFYEQNKDSVFVSAKSANVDFAMLKLINKTYEISLVTLNEPVFHLVQNRQKFNFSDLITRFTPKDTLNRDTIPTKFNILDIEINKGKFYYDELAIPVHYFITDLDIKSPGKRWNVDSIEFDIKFKNGPGPGDIRCNGAINLKKLDYRVKAVVEKFDLKIFEQYLRDLANYGSLSANLDADVNASGNFTNQLNLKVAGYVGVNDFHFGKAAGNDFASFKKIGLNMKYISPLNYEYIFDTIGIIEPFFQFERYDRLDNLQRMFGIKGGNIDAARADAGKFNLILEIADFLKVLGRNFIKSHYKANKLAIYDGNFGYNDYAIREKFAVYARPFNLLAKDIDRNNARLKVDLKTGVYPHGKIQIGFSANPKDFTDFDVDYSITELAVPDLNPYTITYTSFPFKSGTIEFKGKWDVKNGNIDSRNNLVIINPQLTKRIKKKDTKWIPMPLILAVVKEPGNYIDYEIPIRGNLKDPKFKIADVILDILRNLFVKPPTTPYRAYVKTQENEIEKFQLFRWEMHQASVSKKQERFLERLSDFMRKNPDAKVYVKPVLFAEKEREHMLFFEAKKKYYLNAYNKKSTEFNSDDSLFVEKMSVKDAGFLAMLDSKIDSSSLLFTIQEKCSRYVDTNIIPQKMAALAQIRKETFLVLFRDERISSRLKFSAQQIDFPRGGFSYYQISYDGEIPDKLRKALENLDEDVAQVLK